MSWVKWLYSTFLIRVALVSSLCAQHTSYLQVHFLYGSKPAKKYKDVENKWFGGVLGGHVGLGLDSTQILNFIPQGKFHYFAKKHKKHSSFVEHNYNGFYGIFGGKAEDMKKAIIYIPITLAQKQKYDSLSLTYLQNTPYDYAFWGMRCGAATHDILGKLGIMPSYSHSKTIRKVFYPKKLRKRLLKKAKKNNWLVESQEGTKRRKWEKD